MDYTTINDSYPNYPWKAAIMFPKHTPVVTEKGARLLFKRELESILDLVLQGKSAESVIRDRISDYSVRRE